MKLRKVFLIIVSVLMLIIPSNSQAKIYSCTDYSADDCPSSACRVDNGVCVKAHVGDSFCTDKNVMNAMRVLGYFIFIAKIFIPLIIIGFSVFDMYRAITGGDDKSLKESAKRLGIRTLIGFIVFLIPSILNVILTSIDAYDDILSDSYVCQTCLLKPQDCENGVPSDTNLYDKDIFVPSETYDPDNSKDNANNEENNNDTTDEEIIVE